jgi:hypothetical protein
MGKPGDDCSFAVTSSILESVLTCPPCGFARLETVPTNACQFFYECTNCKTLLRPKPGDCCVFCSFDSVKCPSSRNSAAASGDVTANSWSASVTQSRYLTPSRSPSCQIYGPKSLRSHGPISR